jgi:hypothetical protein
MSVNLTARKSAVYHEKGGKTVSSNSNSLPFVGKTDRPLREGCPLEKAAKAAFDADENRAGSFYARSERVRANYRAIAHAVINSIGSQKDSDAPPPNRDELLRIRAQNIAMILELYPSLADPDAKVSAITNRERECWSLGYVEGYNSARANGDIS